MNKFPVLSLLSFTTLVIVAYSTQIIWWQRNHVMTLRDDATYVLTSFNAPPESPNSPAPLLPPATRTRDAGNNRPAVQLWPSVEFCYGSDSADSHYSHLFLCRPALVSYFLLCIWITLFIKRISLKSNRGHLEKKRVLMLLRQFGTFALSLSFS